MTDSPRAVVIGSGIGGSAATLLLAHAGIPTTLLEKNRRIGGSCSGYDKQGFHIDLGTHMFCRGPHGPLGDVLRRVREPSRSIDFRRTRDIAELRFPERAGMRLRAHEGVVRIAVPASVARMPRFAFDVARALGMSVRDATRAARLFTHILTMGDDEIASWNGRTIEDFLAPYVDHAPTIGLFGFLLGLYFILPYWEVSAGEAIWSFQRMARDTSSVPARRVDPDSVHLRATRRDARRRGPDGVGVVIVRDGRTRGVGLPDGHPASTSSSRRRACGRPCSHLAGARAFSGGLRGPREEIRGSFIAVQAKIGLRRKLVDAGAIVGGVGELVDLLGVTTADLKEMFAAVQRGEVPPIVPFCCPSPRTSTRRSRRPTISSHGVRRRADERCDAARPRARLGGGDVPDDPSCGAAARRERACSSTGSRLRSSRSGSARSSAPRCPPANARSGRPESPTVVRAGPWALLRGCNAGARGVGTEARCGERDGVRHRVLVDLGRDLAPRARTTPVRAAGAWIANAAARHVAWATRV